jgi:hypothetical protein
MNASFTTSAGRDPLTAWIDLRLAANPTVADALYAGSIFHYNIRTRTEQGVDYQNQPFIPYSKAYAREKSKRLGHADTVDLFGFQLHPHMLNSIVFSGGGIQQPLDGGISIAGTDPIDHFEIGFYGEEAVRAEAINEGRQPQPIRRFFDVTADDVAQAERGVGELIDARLSSKI